MRPFLFAREKVHTLYLEFDDERSGGFAPLRYVSPDKTVVLGLVTTKRPDLEDPERIRERIKEAAQYVPLSRLSLSPQCGFASTEIGNKLTEEDQWKKIDPLCATLPRRFGDNKKAKEPEWVLSPFCYMIRSKLYWGSG